MDFFAGDYLRWNFGFENPNKAAALIVSLLPLTWSGWVVGWKIRNQIVKLTWLGVTAVIACAGWWLLFKTYSRGGIVAALAGTGYFAWCQTRNRWTGLTRAENRGWIICVGLL